RSLRCLLPRQRARAAAERHRRPLAARGGWRASSKDDDAMLKQFAVAAALVASAAPIVHAQPPAAPREATAARDEGIPVEGDPVRSRGGGCPKSDDQKRMSRISYRRATPENWERTIKRMVTLNHATLDPADARAILKYLADRQGLAPDELRPIAFEAERR